MNREKRWSRAEIEGAKLFIDILLQNEKNRDLLTNK